MGYYQSIVKWVQTSDKSPQPTLVYFLVANLGRIKIRAEKNG